MLTITIEKLSVDIKYFTSLPTQLFLSLLFVANHLTDRDALRLAEGLKNNSTLTHIDLSHNDMGELAGIHLGSALVSFFDIIPIPPTHPIIGVSVLSIKPLGPNLVHK